MGSPIKFIHPGQSRNRNRDMFVLFSTFSPDTTGEVEVDSALEEAIEFADAGATIFIGDGEYLIDSVTIDKDVSFYLTPGARLVHKTNATGPMLNYTEYAGGFFQGGILDGDKTSQGGAVWYPLLNAETDTRFTVRDTKFEDFTFSGVRSLLTTGRLEVYRCTFKNGAKHGGVLNDKMSTGIWFQVANPAITDQRPFVDVTYCEFIQDDAPTTHGENPGGVIVAGSDSVNVHPSVNISHNTFKNIGQDIHGNHIGCVDLYEDVLNATVSFNHVINARYNALKMQNCGRLVCTGNILEGDDADTYSMILYDPQQRTQSDGVYDDAIISNNILEDDTTQGIIVQGVNAATRRVSILGNHVRGFSGGVTINGTVGTAGIEGPFVVALNTIKNTQVGATQFGGIYVTNFSGHIRITGNDVESTGNHCLLATSGCAEAYFHLSENVFTCNTNGFFALALRGQAGIYSTSGTYINSAGGGAVQIQQDASANTVGELDFDQDRNRCTGTVNITYADVDRCIGTVTGSGNPNGTINAHQGTFYQRTDVRSLWYKGSGTANTGWTVIRHGSGGVVVTGDYSAKVSDSVIVVDATAGPIAIDLPPAVEADGLTFMVLKKDVSANAVTIRPQGSDTLSGGNITLPAVRDAKMFATEGLVWYPGNFV